MFVPSGESGGQGHPGQVNTNAGINLPLVFSGESAMEIAKKLIPALFALWMSSKNSTIPRGNLTASNVPALEMPADDNVVKDVEDVDVAVEDVTVEECEKVVHIGDPIYKQLAEDAENASDAEMDTASIHSDSEYSDQEVEEFESEDDSDDDLSNGSELCIPANVMLGRQQSRPVRVELLAEGFDDNEMLFRRHSLPSVESMFQGQRNGGNAMIAQMEQCFRNEHERIQQWYSVWAKSATIGEWNVVISTMLLQIWKTRRTKPDDAEWIADLKLIYVQLQCNRTNSIVAMLGMVVTCPTGSYSTPLLVFVPCSAKFGKDVDWPDSDEMAPNSPQGDLVETTSTNTSYHHGLEHLKNMAPTRTRNDAAKKRDKKSTSSHEPVKDPDKKKREKASNGMKKLDFDESRNRDKTSRKRHKSKQGSVSRMMRNDKSGGEDASESGKADNDLHNGQTNKTEPSDALGDERKGGEQEAEPLDQLQVNAEENRFPSLNPEAKRTRKRSSEIERLAAKGKNTTLCSYSSGRKFGELSSKKRAYENTELKTASREGVHTLKTHDSTNVETNCSDRACLHEDFCKEQWLNHDEKQTITRGGLASRNFAKMTAKSREVDYPDGQGWHHRSKEGDLMVRGKDDEGLVCKMHTNENEGARQTSSIDQTNRPVKCLQNESVEHQKPQNKRSFIQHTILNALSILAFVYLIRQPVDTTLSETTIIEMWPNAVRIVCPKDQTASKIIIASSISFLGKSNESNDPSRNDKNEHPSEQLPADESTGAQNDRYNPRREGVNRSIKNQAAGEGNGEDRENHEGNSNLTHLQADGDLHVPLTSRHRANLSTNEIHLRQQFEGVVAWSPGDVGVFDPYADDSHDGSERSLVSMPSTCTSEYASSYVSILSASSQLLRSEEHNDSFPRMPNSEMPESVLIFHPDHNCFLRNDPMLWQSSEQASALFDSNATKDEAENGSQPMTSLLPHSSQLSGMPEQQQDQLPNNFGLLDANFLDCDMPIGNVQPNQNTQEMNNYSDDALIPTTLAPGVDATGPRLQLRPLESRGTCPPVARVLPYRQTTDNRFRPINRHYMDVRPESAASVMTLSDDNVYQPADTDLEEEFPMSP